MRAAVVENFRRAGSSDASEDFLIGFDGFVILDHAVWHGGEFARFVVWPSACTDPALQCNFRAPLYDPIEMYKTEGPKSSRTFEQCECHQV